MNAPPSVAPPRSKSRGDKPVDQEKIQSDTRVAVAARPRKDRWEMTPSEALRVNYVTSEI